MHDLHLHTNLSACAPPESTLKVMLRALKEAGITIELIDDLRSKPKMEE